MSTWFDQFASSSGYGVGPGVDGGEGDARLLVVLVVEGVGRHHEAELRVLVRFRAVEVVPAAASDQDTQARAQRGYGEEGALVMEGFRV